VHEVKILMINTKRENRENTIYTWMRKMIDISRRSHKDERESERRKREEEEK
jgi:hypothetical protein